MARGSMGAPRQRSAPMEEIRILARAGANIRERRLRAQMTRDELEREAGIGHATLLNAESTGRMNLATFLSIARALGCPMGELLDGLESDDEGQGAAAGEGVSKGGPCPGAR